MKSVIIAIMIFLASWDAEKPDYISFEYSGDTDKTVDMIFISRTPLAQSDMVTTLIWTGVTFNFIVDDKDFNRIKELISVTRKEDHAGYYGYKIVVRENGLTAPYFIARENSYLMFNEIVKSLKDNPKNKDLIPALKYLALDH